MVGRVGVVVLGDLGRSPRMRYHALSLASSGFQVSFTVFLVFFIYSRSKEWCGFGRIQAFFFNGPENNFLADPKSDLKMSMIYKNIATKQV